MIRFDMRRSYAREKFGSAVDRLATSPETIHDRLYDAYLSFSPLSAADFKNDDERAIFEEIMATLTSEAAIGDEGTVRATLNKMNDDQASSVASLIVSLASRLSSEE